MDNVEQRLSVLELQVSQLLERCNLLGRQITEMKNVYIETLKEVKILKEGGNF